MTATSASTWSKLLELARHAEPPAKLQHALARVRGAYALRGTEHGARCSVTGPVRVQAEGLIHLGRRVQLLGGLVPSALFAARGAVLSLGDDCQLNYGVTLRARESVILGNRCMLGSYVVIADDGGGRLAPIRLGDDVWVAYGAQIAPGVTIGDGAVVSAGSVVTRDVPPRTLALGRPARVMSLDLAGRAPGKEAS